MRLVAATNIMGGVGKTATTVHLAYLAAQSGRATLLWDLDPQRAATYTLHGEPHDRVSARKLVRGTCELLELIAPTAYTGLRLIPADFSYRNLEVHLSERKHPTERLKMMTRSLHDEVASSSWTARQT